MFASLTVEKLEKNTNDWVWLSNFIVLGKKESQTGRGSVVFRPFEDLLYQDLCI